MGKLGEKVNGLSKTINENGHRQQCGDCQKERTAEEGEEGRWDKWRWKDLTGR